MTVTYATATGQVAMAASATPADQSSGPCTLDIPGLYFFTCDGVQHNLTAATTIHVPGRLCDPPEIIGNFDNVVTPERGGGGGGGGPGAIIIIDPPGVETPVNCDACLEELAAAMIQAAWNTYPPTKFLTEIIEANNIFNSIFFNDRLRRNRRRTPRLSLPWQRRRSIRSMTSSSWGRIPISRICLDSRKPSGTIGTRSTTVASGPGSGAGGLIGLGPPPGSALGDGLAATAIPSAQPDTGDNATLNADLATVEADLQNAEQLTGPAQEIFGSYDWVDTSQPTTEAEWLSAFSTDVADTTDGSIDAADQAQLLATTLPQGVTQQDAMNFIQRREQHRVLCESGHFPGVAIAPRRERQLHRSGPVGQFAHRREQRDRQEPGRRLLRSRNRAPCRGRAVPYRQQQRQCLRLDHAADRPERHADAIGVFRALDIANNESVR